MHPYDCGQWIWCAFQSDVKRDVFTEQSGGVEG